MCFTLTETWKECYRVLKQGKLAFVMCSPRQDVLARMIINLQDAGFRTNYSSIYWTYASGFPKAANVSKLIDKRFKRKTEYDQLASYLKQHREQSGISVKELAKSFPSRTGGITGCVWNWENAENEPTQEQYQTLKQKLNLDDSFDWLIEQETKRYEEAEREIIGQKPYTSVDGSNAHFYYKPDQYKRVQLDETKPATEEAKKMEGAYVGFQPKPAVEVILVVSKGRTISWLDDCRIPYQSEDDKGAGWHKEDYGFGYREWSQRMGYDKVKKELERGEPPNEKGRFPANLIVENDVLNNGKDYKVGDINQFRRTDNKIYGQSNKGELYTKQGDEGSYSCYFSLDQWADKTLPFLIVAKASRAERGSFNTHATVKPLKLMSYLITMGAEGDLVLDPFCGSGTVCMQPTNFTGNGWASSETPNMQRL